MGHDNGTGSFSRHFFSAKSFSWSVYVLGIVFHLLFTLERNPAAAVDCSTDYGYATCEAVLE